MFVLAFVGNGGVLTGNGTISGPVMIGAAILRPGASAGTLSTGDLTLGSLMNLQFELATAGISGGSNDFVSVTGNLTLDGTLTVLQQSGFSAGAYRLFDSSGGLIDNGLELESSFLTAHPGSFIDVTPNQVTLQVLPEPSCALFLCGSSVVLILRMRQRVGAKIPLLPTRGTTADSSETDQFTRGDLSAGQYLWLGRSSETRHCALG